LRISNQSSRLNCWSHSSTPA